MKKEGKLMNTKKRNIFKKTLRLTQNLNKNNKKKLIQKDNSR